MAAERADDRSRDSLRVHARLQTMSHTNQSPVGNHTIHASHTCFITLNNQVFGTGGIKELDVGKRKKLTENGRSEEGCMFHNHVCPFIIVRDLQFIKDVMCRLANNL